MDRPDKADKPDRVREVSPAYGPKAGSLTYSDYMEIPDDGRFELVEGDFCMVPTPTVMHQEVSKRIERALYWAEDTGLGVVQHALLDVVLDDHNVLQPDVVFVAEARRGIVTQIGIFGAPDLVVEILSPSTEKRDRVTKRQLYGKYGVQELWLVDTEGRTIEVFRNQDGRLEAVETVSGERKVTSPLLPGFSVAASRLFGA